MATGSTTSGTTVFFSSHILSQVEAVCDRVAILNEGRLVAEDTIDGLRQSVGTGSAIELQVDEIPSNLALADLPNVSDVSVTDTRIRVTCLEPTAKAAAINRVQERGATVLDITTSDSSLEDLFTAYTETEVVA